MDLLRRGRTRTEFERFAALYADALLRSAYLMAGDRGEAEDLVQECLLRLARKRPHAGSSAHSRIGGSPASRPHTSIPQAVAHAWASSHAACRLTLYRRDGDVSGPRTAASRSGAHHNGRFGLCAVNTRVSAQPSTVLSIERKRPNDWVPRCRSGR